MKPTLATAIPSLLGRRDVGRIVRRGRRFVGLRLRLLGFLVVMLGWQLALFLALLGEAIELDVYLAVHFLGCFAFAVWLYRRSKTYPTDDQYPAALQIVAWSVFAGPFGAFVATAFLCPSPIGPKILRDRESDSATADGSAIDHAERMHVALLDSRVRIEGASRIRPLMDVIADGAQPQKLEALGVVYRKYEASLSAVLKRALRDPDPSVRVLAANVMAKLHAIYSDKIGHFQSATAGHPRLALGWRNLAEARLAYAESGLLEAARARAQIEFAVSDLSHAAELDADDQASASLLDMARRQLSLGRV
jgi:hypothetical protein